MEIRETHPEICLKTGSDLAWALRELVRQEIARNRVIDNGLNLRQVVAPHGDKVWYASEDPGRGGRSGLGLNLPPSQTPIFFSNVLANGEQGWIRFDLNGIELVAYAMPRPHMPGTVLITKVVEDLQSWRGSSSEETAKRVDALIELVLNLSLCLPGWRLSYNNIHSGQSLSQWHVCANVLPPGIEQLPVEREVEQHAFGKHDVVLALSESRNYPVPVFAAIGRPRYVVENIARAVCDWDVIPEATGNLMMVHDPRNGLTTGLFWPRITTWRRAPGFQSGEIAVLELAGYFILSDQGDLTALANGGYGYRHFWCVLRSIADSRAFVRCANWAR